MRKARQVLPTAPSAILIPNPESLVPASVYTIGLWSTGAGSEAFFLPPRP
jgi:hypothetical protein